MSAIERKSQGAAAVQPAAATAKPISSNASILQAEVTRLLGRIGVDPSALRGDLASRTPIDGGITAHVPETTAAQAHEAIELAAAAFARWRLVPAPRRGELVRRLGDALRASREDLGRLVSIETGKIASEGAGEVQEMIDICDFATGLSRQLYGLTIASERPGHRMMETWHPLGVVGVISAFNFPVAVWAWNAVLALVCGDPVVWKPSEKTPLTALAVQAIFERVAREFERTTGTPATGLLHVLTGGRTPSEALADHPAVPLVSATGSTAMGRSLAPRLARRFARALLELGGNNGAIVCPSADQELALRAIAFAWMGTAGQRCTSLRRLFVHRDLADSFVPRLARVAASVVVGDPLEAGTLVGPLIDRAAFDSMQAALKEAASEGGAVEGGVREHAQRWANAWYARPAVVSMPRHSGPVLRETFAPILYVMRYTELDEAIAAHNAVAAGLSSSIFTRDAREAERFVAADGSDCGLANVNIGPSGAEIGGAFGGEKETGGGRESGSDSWKIYMRRATNTINFSGELPLAQGVKFDIG
ncbi:MAG: aldehyde dehydrogenase family protein [Burkholderiaceae bacterium]|nr:aldehyde dehydrogenase family protein [Burkholderiaceae bacterium]